MITITIYKVPGGHYQGFKVLGHADSVEEGADLVCCSVSVLTINLMNSLDIFTSDRFQQRQDEETGLVEVMFLKTPTKEADLLMRSYELGITSIAKEYEPWLRVITKEVQQA